MAILNRLLHFLKLLEELVEFGEFLTTPLGSTGVFCLLSYQAFALMGCDVTTATILASTAALTLYCTMNRPTY
ncbi:hypothetical protein [Leptolyngbya iicbica]|uniref:Uncharacterized protein n=2 Tax=Cyanophyceae TaxID=3028117 RepID=A0A4Q7EFI6_9CYAN|nr:hypothetical protein [Leptolyngbya sp. LK]RZM82002.1 hypothetical protein DYY88_01670 [Leptolyngbya sp. LK]